MRVEIVANKLSEFDRLTNPDGEQHFVAKKGDVLTVSDAFGQHLCDQGWAKDTAGKYPSKPFTPGAAKLAPAKLVVTPPGKGR